MNTKQHTVASNIQFLSHKTRSQISMQHSRCGRLRTLHYLRVSRNMHRDAAMKWSLTTYSGVHIPLNNFKHINIPVPSSVPGSVITTLPICIANLHQYPDHLYSTNFRNHTENLYIETHSVCTICIPVLQCEQNASALK